MPRDLTDLMERATASAPPEPHAAADITAAATRHLRRRRAGVAGSIAVAVVAATGIGYGVTRGHESNPQPAGHYRYGLHQDLVDAQPLSSLPGFRTLHYPVPAIERHVGSSKYVVQWQAIDPAGRLVVRHFTRPHSGRPVGGYELLPGPGLPARDLPEPPFTASPRQRAAAPWSVRFTGDGRLLWDDVLRDGLTDFVTGLDGSNAVAVQRTTDDLPGDTGVFRHSVAEAWVVGDRVWFTAVTRAKNPDGRVDKWYSLFSFPLGHPGQLRREVPRDAVEIEVADGQAVWVDASATGVYHEDLATGDVRRIPLRLDAGCRLVRAGDGSPTPTGVTTNGSAVSLEEFCAGERYTRLLVVDMSGRLVTDIDAGRVGYIAGVTMTDRRLVFMVYNGVGGAYADDLATGRLTELGGPGPMYFLPMTAGRYVAWNDQAGQHVGEFGS
jgi:hypothetical protein